MDKCDAIAQLNKLIKEGKSVLNTSYSSGDVLGGPWVESKLYSSWRTRVIMLLHEVLPEHQQTQLKRLEVKRNSLTSIAREWQAQLQGTLDAIKNGVIEFDGVDGGENDALIERILERFPNVVASINHRHAGRDGFVINDEYDVQDLLRSICKAYFDDVRDEEAVPSFAGKNSRCDLFLRKEDRFIEIKMTRNNLCDRKLGEELSVDISQYGGHPGCKRLFCFIYDPGRFVSNPIGLKHDLEKIIPNFVTVIITY